VINKTTANQSSAEVLRRGFIEKTLPRRILSVSTVACIRTFPMENAF
jgi:hypothetical protein